MIYSRAAFLHSEEVEQYSYPPECPFKTQRAAMTRDILRPMGLLSGPSHFIHPPATATREELESFHTRRYLETLKEAQAGRLEPEALFMGLGTEDCPVFSGMYEYAALAAGASLTGARLLLDDKAGLAFNPSGGFHHAEPERAAGFCYINDVVIVCKMLAGRGKRVFCLDLDVHHGDGVQNAFYDRCDVMTVSFHESGKTLFPGGGFPDEIGEGEGRGYNVNVGLPRGTYDAPYLRAVREVAVPLLSAFGPDVVVLEIGMDGLSGDPLAHLSLTNNAYADAVSEVARPGLPLLLLGGGGYNPRNAARGWALVWNVLCGKEGTSELELALGGVMLETTDWQGGLRDRTLVPEQKQVESVNPAVDASIRTVRDLVFPIHGI